MRQLVYNTITAVPAPMLNHISFFNMFQNCDVLYAVNENQPKGEFDPTSTFNAMVGKIFNDLVYGKVPKFAYFIKNTVQPIPILLMKWVSVVFQLLFTLRHLVDRFWAKKQALINPNKGIRMQNEMIK